MAERDDLEPVPWGPVGAVAGAVVLLLLAVANRYGWHRDELYFLEAGRHHLQWGYVDQPPFTPFVARVADAVAPGNLVVLRLLPALTTALTIVLGVLIARELGARRRGQVLAAAAMASGGFLLGVGHLLSTAAFDLTAWTALLWCAARLLRTGCPRWWLAFGAIAGAAMLNKDLVVLLAGSLAVGLVVERRWRLLWTPWLAAGVAVAAVIALPNLLWQADHGWPQQDMARALSERIGDENRVTLLPLQLLFAGPLLVPVLWAGARWLGGDATARRFRALLWAWPAAIVAALVTGGRPYYVLPLTTLVLLAGIVARERRGATRRIPWLIVPNAVVSVLVGLPVLPVSAVNATAALNEVAAEQVGWPELVDQLAAVVRALPADEQASVVLLARTYGEAGAIDRFGPARGLPPAHSPHNGYADFRVPTDDDATVVVVRWDVHGMGQWFESCEQVATVDNGRDVDNEVQGAPILVCRGLRGTWPDVWEQLRFLS